MMSAWLARTNRGGVSSRTLSGSSLLLFRSSAAIRAENLVLRKATRPLYRARDQAAACRFCNYGSAWRFLPVYSIGMMSS